jgi:hypothetical protein
MNKCIGDYSEKYRQKLFGSTYLLRVRRSGTQSLGIIMVTVMGLDP